MLELASDPECIQFTHGKRISLPLLKHEIDRRMLKIACLVKRMERKRRSSSPHHRQARAEHKHVQTEATASDELALHHSPVLAVVNDLEKKNRLQPASNAKSNRQQERRQPRDKLS
jgi:hypothetical protein